MMKALAMWFLAGAALFGVALFTQMRPAEAQRSAVVAAAEPSKPPTHNAELLKKRPKEKMLTWETLKPEETSPKHDDKLTLSEEDWRKRLTPDQFKILRSHGTDPAFCGILEDNKESGVYYCAGCDLPLFVSENKFNSGTGWPSFFLPYSRENVWFRTDRSYGMIRVEVLCARCDGHLGHVFPDGPKPSGTRFCINGNALNFQAND